MSVGSHDALGSRIVYIRFHQTQLHNKERLRQRKPTASKPLTGLTKCTEYKL